MLSLKDGLTPCYSLASQPGQVSWNREANGYRLPTEQEWEYAVQTGKSTVLGSIWSKENTSAAQSMVHSQPNRKGVYDLLGNVWEWCWDQTRRQECIVRGGSFLCSATDISIDSREARSALHQSPEVGFRLVRDETID